MARVTGTPGKDILRGTIESDRMFGRGGDDLYIYEVRSRTTFDFGVRLDFRTVDDIIEKADAGTDTVHLFNLTSGETRRDAWTFQMPPHVEIAEAKTEDRWEIIGNGLPNILFGNVGHDTIAGGAQGDTLRGKRGDDVLLGGAGADVLVGDVGHDTLEGGPGDDTIDGGLGIDVLRLTAAGGARFDLGNAGPQRTGDGRDTVFDIEGVLGGPGNDTLRGSGGDDLIGGGAGDDRIIGRGGNDTLFLGAGNDTLKGGGGLDLLTYEGVGDLTIDLAREQATLPDGIALFSGIEVVEAGQGDDRLLGANTSDTLRGGGGDDLLLGRDGADDLSGGAGNDTLRGGRGSDTLDGGSGSDLLNGNGGADALIGGSGSTLVGGGGNDTLSGGDGGVLRGGGGNDRLEGGQTQFGGSGADILVSGGVMNGQGGDDFLSLDASNRRAVGGTGSDQFAIAEPKFFEERIGVPYIIEDFSAEDTLNLISLDPSPSTPQNDAFVFESSPRFDRPILDSNSDAMRFDVFFPLGGGNVTLINVDNDLVVALDTDENRVADTLIVLRDYQDPLSWLL